MAVISDDYTLNRILDIIKQVAEGHPMLADYSFDTPHTRGHDVEDNEESNFPYMQTDFVGFTPEIAHSNLVAINYQIMVFVCDKQSENAKNDQEILSDTATILQDVIKYLTTHPDFRKFKILIPGQVRAAKHETRDNVHGVEVVLTVRVPYKFCYTNLPITI